MKKILFLTNGKNDMVASKKYNEYVCVAPIYKYSFRLYKMIAKLMIKKRKNEKKVRKLLGKWASHLNEYDIIICEGLKGKKWVFEFLLKNKEEKTQIVMWHWNKIYENEINPKDEIARKCEQWSFDPDDCKNYGLKFNTQYFFKSIDKEKLRIKWDAYFLGADKDRANTLMKLKGILEDINLRVNFHIVKVKQQNNKKIKYKKCISYKRNLINVIKTKILIDFPISGQRGLTLRVLEALFYKRKLISFNEELKNQSFYNENNILLLTEQELDSEMVKIKIQEFINKPYQDTKENEKARKTFSFEEWILRFDDSQ